MLDWILFVILLLLLLLSFVTITDAR